MYKIVTVKANAQEIITLKCVWHQICTKSLLCRQMLRKNVTSKCIWHQICTKSIMWRQMLRESSLQNAFGTKYVQNHYLEGKWSGNCHFYMHLAPNMYKTVTLNANAKKIVTLKCIWHHICTKLLLCRQMLRKLLL